MKLKVAIFDLDGTLVDSHPVIIKALQSACSANGIDVDPEYARSLIGLPTEQMFARIISEPLLAKVAVRYFDNEIDKLDIEIKAFTGTVETLRGLSSKGIKLALLTNRGSEGAREILKRNQFSNFDIIIGRDSINKLKPHPAGLYRIMEHLDINRDEAIFVGDSLQDFECGQNANIMTVGAGWNRHCQNFVDVNLVSLQRLEQIVLGSNV